ncbi:UDP-glucose 4-epimerase GalE [Niveibacterium microcysteis]|uniref:UDP-glucose 4-epimerase n=1 Tax=Niveibacterium microcysteis TaxID=2811415 RepID=A0ABX7MA30_9RHOO|nr:UDP-glucose 4-epimerase GalE [Niveibacterium microcysteis]QSI78506.1 UDP-glucose 4-epimerase GalE [Niveibacterium microcysteis]
MKILVTGGAGYIGSITSVQLIGAGYEPVIVDNFCNASPKVLDRIEHIAGRRPTLYTGDIRDRALLDRIFAEHKIDAVIHFAALKAVGESVAKPLAYYENNLGGTFVLLEAMRAAGVKNFVFSSSATVYGDPASVPIREDFPTRATNPYGWTKLMMEQVLTDFQHATPDWSVTLLRYFNPVGAHPSGLMGEDPQGIPNNLMPYLAQVAVGRREYLSVYGSDYPTPDGTGVRDYIHVMDLADGHIAALKARQGRAGVHVFNLGTGHGNSVLEMVAAFGRAVGRELPYKLVDRRPGDIAECWADPAYAERELGWRATRSLDDMTRDTWKWQSLNPNGYQDA